jgi:hypothetical protein
MSDSESENEQRLTLEDLEGSDTEMLSGDEDGPMDILTQQRVTINNEVNYTYLLPRAEQDPLIGASYYCSSNTRGTGY